MVQYSILLPSIVIIISSSIQILFNCIIFNSSFKYHNYYLFQFINCIIIILKENNQNYTINKLEEIIIMILERRIEYYTIKQNLNTGRDNNYDTWKKN